MGNGMNGQVVAKERGLLDLEVERVNESVDNLGKDIEMLVGRIDEVLQPDLPTTTKVEEKTPVPNLSRMTQRVAEVRKKIDFIRGVVRNATGRVDI